jgi:hypothetical protein
MAHPSILYHPAFESLHLPSAKPGLFQELHRRASNRVGQCQSELAAVRLDHKASNVSRKAEADGIVRANKFHQTCRGIGDGMQAKGIMRNTGSPSGDRGMDQLAAREEKCRR